MLKYVVNDYPFPTLYFGIANVIANGLIMLRYVDHGHIDAVTGLRLTSFSVPSFCGYLRTWKMTTPTI